MSEWQNIETAPKNGKWLWVHGNSEYGVCWVVASWRDDHWRMPEGGIVVPVQWKPMPDWYDPCNPQEPTEAQLKEMGFRVNKSDPLLKDIKRELHWWAYKFCGKGTQENQASDVMTQALLRIEELEKAYKQQQEVWSNAIARADRYEAALQKIAAIEDEHINVPKTDEGANLWACLAMCVELAETELREKKDGEAI